LENGQPIDTVFGPVSFDAKGDVKDPHFDINQCTTASTRDQPVSKGG